MRKSVAFLIAFLLLIGCKHFKDKPVAEAFHHKLYLSEVLENTPFLTSKEDSLVFMEQYVDEWVKRKTLLAYAQKVLFQKEQKFSAQIKAYKEQLLLNAYMQKISRDSTLYPVTKEEFADFYSQYKPDDSPEYRDMIKLNYIKVSIHSKLYKKIKELFFDENDRVNALKQLENICADTIEYYLDSEHWFYTDFIENELPFSFSGKENFDYKDKFEFVRDDYRFLVLVLEKKRQLQPKNTPEDRKMAQTLLFQQKRAEFLIRFQDSLVQKALTEKKAIRFGFTNY